MCLNVCKAAIFLKYKLIKHVRYKLKKAEGRKRTIRSDSVTFFPSMISMIDLL